jgi:hypothetical protein
MRDAVKGVSERGTRLAFGESDFAWAIRER